MDKVSIFLNNITPDVLEPEDYVRWDKIEENMELFLGVFKCRLIT